jgi:hypothetical protein
MVDSILVIWITTGSRASEVATAQALFWPPGNGLSFRYLDSRLPYDNFLQRLSLVPRSDIFR